MKFLAPVLIALSSILQLAAAECAPCITKGFAGSTVCATRTYGCGFCCRNAHECQLEINLGNCPPPSRRPPH
ncbi:hypothetical protein Vi05172_g7142 [Venturia inaequalis]|nr:hypothetical protein Vi05172_g7142 [Venturia inaequalis]